jgi:hypothetical protein
VDCVIRWHRAVGDQASHSRFEGPEAARLLLDILSTREAQLAADALVTVQHGRLRLRNLPIAGKPQ